MKAPTNLFVAGTFDDRGGHESKIASLIYSGMHCPHCDDASFSYYNGGSFKVLEDLVKSCQEYKVIYWFADVPNDKPKLVNAIKSINPECILVTSKRNDGKYSFGDLIYHAFNLKSNLALEFMVKERIYTARVFDPLGNVFLDHSHDFDLVGKVLSTRANELSAYTRVHTKSLAASSEVPRDEEFFQLIMRYGKEFHNLVHSHPSQTNRFLGNASFRPEGSRLVFVTRRNMDKRNVSKDSFVALEPWQPFSYYGKVKPSVDAASQLLLYNYHPWVRYMLHFHAYVDKARFTEKVIPCGALEEAFDIIKLKPENDDIWEAVNLRGHGSLVMAYSINGLADIHYIERKIPEVHDYGNRF